MEELKNKIALCDISSSELLLDASKNGQDGPVTDLISAGADVNSEDETGTTALLSASRHGHVGCVRELITAGADVNKANSGKFTPLMWASGEGHTECVKLLIEAGAGVNSCDRHGCTPLMHATKHGHEQCVEALVHAGADVNADLVLNLAIEENQVECAQTLIDLGADVNEKDDDGRTPLMNALQATHEGYWEFERLLDNSQEMTTEQDPELLKVQERHKLYFDMLLKAGADVNQKDRGGFTALEWAAKSGNVKAVEMLIEAGADVNNVIKGEYREGNTSLMLAADEDHPDCVDLLIKAGADVNHMTDASYFNWDTRGGSALTLACELCYHKCVDLLVEAGADVNTADVHGYTPLMATLMQGRRGEHKCINKLIKAGANVNAVKQKGYFPGYTMLMFAAKNHCVKCIKLLLEFGAGVNLHGEEALPILHVAALNGFHKCIPILVRAGADVNATDEEGNTPLMLKPKQNGSYFITIRGLHTLLLEGVLINKRNRRDLNALEHYITSDKFNYRCLSDDEIKDIINFLYAAGETLDGDTVTYRELESESESDDSTTDGAAANNHPVSAEEIPVPKYLLHRRKGGKPNLKHQCRETIRRHLIELEPHQHLFGKIPQLEMPTSLTQYLLYDVSVEYSDDENSDTDSSSEDDA